MDEFQTLLEKFSNGVSLTPLLKKVYQFSRAVEDDFVMRHFVHDAGVFLHESVVDPMFVKRRDYIAELSELIRRF